MLDSKAEGGGVTTEAKDNKSSVVLFALIGVLVLVLIGLGAYVLGRDTSDKKATTTTAQSDSKGSTPKYDYGLLNQITDILNREYVKPDNLNGQALANAALAGLLNPLNDSGTYYLDPTAYKNSQAPAGSLGDPGISVLGSSGGITIAGMAPGGAASTSGIKTGDIIATIDGESTSGWSSREATLRLAGPPGTQVKVAVRSTEDPKPREFTLERKQPPANLVSATPPPQGLKNSKGEAVAAIGYVRISDFTTATQDQLANALKQVSAGGQPLVLDLRDNPGTDIKAGLAAANLLVDSGTLALQQDSAGKETTFPAKSGVALKHGKVAILINNLSRSGAEVFAAALHDNGVATIIGQKSAGQASTSDVKQLDNGGAVFVSISEWFGPKHQLIEKSGLTPDIEIAAASGTETGDPQLARALDTLGG